MAWIRLEQDIIGLQFYPDLSDGLEKKNYEEQGGIEGDVKVIYYLRNLLYGSNCCDRDLQRTRVFVKGLETGSGAQFGFAKIEMPIRHPKKCMKIQRRGSIWR